MREREDFWILKQFHFKGLHMDLLRLTPSVLRCWGSSLKSTRDIRGRTELSGIRARVGVEGAAFSKREVLAKAMVPLMSPPTTEPIGGHHI